jgi:hypothetical protein
LIPSHPSKPAFRSAKAIALTAAGLICQGFYCGEKSDPPSLPGVTFEDIHLVIKDPDPARETQGIYLAWSYPEDAKATRFEIYQSLSRESPLHIMHVQPAESPRNAVLGLSDTARPSTLYFAVRAVYVEPTGQKQASDTLIVDSISLTPSLSILQPASGSFMPGRALDMEVQTASDPGVVIRFEYYEETGPGWKLKQEGWLPIGPDPTPIFGNSLQRGSLTLDDIAATDTVNALFCVVGTESFQERNTGQTQSLGCTRFFRAGP